MAEIIVRAGRRPNLDALILGLFTTILAFMFGSSPQILVTAT